MKINIGYWISSHGFGHGARASAIMEEMERQLPGCFHFHIFSSLPQWFFQLHQYSFTHYNKEVDPGIVQSSTLEEDLEKTLETAKLWSSPKQIEHMLPLLKEKRISFIIGDIAPLAFWAAEKMSIPSLLLESFTWDWIFEGYSQRESAFLEWIPIYQHLFSLASYHIQTAPLGVRNPQAPLVGPISRKARIKADQILNQLQVPKGSKMILLSLSGKPKNFAFWEALSRWKEFFFVFPSLTAPREIRKGNGLLLSKDAPFFHPDLVRASYGVIGKAGYSSVAEVYEFQKPFLYVSRPFLAETAVLTEFLETYHPSQPLPKEGFYEGTWLNQLHFFDQEHRFLRPYSRGREKAVELILKILRKERIL